MVQVIAAQFRAPISDSQSQPILRPQYNLFLYLTPDLIRFIRIIPVHYQSINMRALSIVLLDGKVLRDTEPLTDMALYVKVLLRTPSQVHEGRTQSVRAGKDSLVTWNQRMTFQDSAIVPGSRLEFFVMDKDLIADDHVANGFANVASCGILAPGVPNVYSMRLYHKGVPAGQIRFESVFQ